MRIESERIEKKDISILESMIQLYLHDISSYFPMDFNETTGKYDYDSLDKYFDNSKNYPYFIKYDDKTAGFMLIDTTDTELIIQEVFILNNYKNKGIGKTAVFDVLNKYRGKWIVKSLPCSKLAENFWNKTVKDYTNDDYNVEYVGKFERAIFTFNNNER